MPRACAAASASADRHGNRQQLGQLESARGNQPVERCALDQLHGEERHAVDFLDRVDGDDVGVVQRGDRAGFAREPAAVFGVVGLEDFERDVALEAGVAGPVDLAHAPDAEQGYDFVGAQALAWQQIHGQAPLRASRSGLRGWRP